MLIVDRVASPDDFAFAKADVSVEGEVAEAFDEAARCFGRLDIAVNNAGIQPLGVGFGERHWRSAGTHLWCECEWRGVRHQKCRPRAGRWWAGHQHRFVCRHDRHARRHGLFHVEGGRHPSDAAWRHRTRRAPHHRERATQSRHHPDSARGHGGIPDNPEIPFIQHRTPLGRLGEPEEVAALAHFLASDEAGYITGQNIAIDGGLTAPVGRKYDLILPDNVRDGKWIDDP